MTSAPDWDALRAAFGVKQPPVDGFSFTVRDLLRGSDIGATAVRTRLTKAVAAGRVVRVREARGHVDAVYQLAKGVTPKEIGDLFNGEGKTDVRRRRA